MWCSHDNSNNNKTRLLAQIQDVVKYSITVNDRAVGEEGRENDFNSCPNLMAPIVCRRKENQWQYPKSNSMSTMTTWKGMTHRRRQDDKEDEMCWPHH